MGKNEQGLKGGPPRYRTIPRVLVFLRNGSDVLLIKGAPQKHIWANQYNGIGGHIERDEDVISAARREVLEETGLEPSSLELQAVVNIDAGDPALGILMFVFTGWSSHRRTRKSDEGELYWVPVDELNRYNLVEDLDWLLPKVMGPKQRRAPLYLYYSYDDDDTLVIRDSS
ncbi:MAG: NUDIX domain-containing protein [Candidatus Promineifilaceae bacterium]